MSALGFRVPNIVKRTLTTLQITQFLVGSAFAAVHLFVSYTVPVSIAYKITEKVAPQASSTVSSAISSATESVAEALPTVTGVAVAFLRKLIYRAAGDEGLAENIPVPGSPIPAHQQQRVVAPAQPEHQNPVVSFFKHNTVDRTVYRTEYQSVPCVDTSGQAFAIYLNLIYLAPLTILFMRFFFKSYLRRSGPSTKGQPKRRTISDAAGDAKRSLEREIDALDKTAEDGISTAVNRARDAVRGRKTNANGSVKDDRHGSLSPANKKFVDNVNRKVNKKLQEIDEGAEATTDKAKQFAKDVAGKAQEAKGKVTDSWQDVKKEAQNEAENGGQKIKQEADNASQKAKQEADKGSEKMRQEADKAHDAANKNSSQQSNDSPSKKSPRKLKKAENKAKQQAEAQKKNGQDDSAVQKPEKEPEPKDINNTLEKDEGKGLF